MSIDNPIKVAHDEAIKSALCTNFLANMVVDPIDSVLKQQLSDGGKVKRLSFTAATSFFDEGNRDVRGSNSKHVAGHNLLEEVQEKSESKIETSGILVHFVAGAFGHCLA